VKKRIGDSAIVSLFCCQNKGLSHDLFMFFSTLFFGANRWKWRRFWTGFS